MSRRYHIIYAHPASQDGYAFFYLSYMPGERHLALRYRQCNDEVREIALAPVAMLDLIENQAALSNVDQVSLRPWDRAAKVLRIRLKRWMAEARQEVE